MTAKPKTRLAVIWLGLMFPAILVLSLIAVIWLALMFPVILVLSFLVAILGGTAQDDEHDQYNE